MNRFGPVWWVLAGIVMLASCGREPEAQVPKVGPAPPGNPPYQLLVHPLHNPGKLLDAYQPLVDYLNEHVPGSRFELEASRDYARFEEKYETRGAELLLPNPWQTLQAMKHGYHVIAMAGEPSDFTGIILVRKDSPIRTPADLKGKAVSYPSPTALAACIMPQYFLHTNGVNINRDIENRYVGSQESSMMNVYLGLTEAGATWPPPWRAFQKNHPAEAAQLKVMWETQPLVNNSIMIRDDVPGPVRERIRTLLLELHRTPEGRAVLMKSETARFLAAGDEDYDVVRRYVERFEREVRPVESK